MTRLMTATAIALVLSGCAYNGVQRSDRSFFFQTGKDARQALARAEAPQDDVAAVEEPDTNGPLSDPPADEAADEGTPADDPPADDPPADDPPADDPPADDPPADEPPADDPPADEPPSWTPPGQGGTPPGQEGGSTPPARGRT